MVVNYQYSKELVVGFYPAVWFVGCSSCKREIIFHGKVKLKVMKDFSPFSIMPDRCFVIDVVLPVARSWVSGGHGLLCSSPFSLLLLLHETLK